MNVSVDKVNLIWGPLSTQIFRCVEYTNVVGTLAFPANDHRPHVSELVVTKKGLALMKQKT